MDTYAAVAAREGMKILGWRDVPTDNSTLGESVKPTEPVHKQVFLARNPKLKSEDEFERRLYIFRKTISGTLYSRRARSTSNYYPVSISCRTLIYKGMFLADQLGTYYPDLRDPDFASALALVHQRFSTNTFPTWSLAHPYRMIAHNGEINTLRGNNNWMAARQASVSSPKFGADIAKLWPISYEGQSDTACFDNALEFLTMGGYPLAHADDDDDSGGVGRQSADERRAPRLLRIQRRADGAVGRPGGDRVYQRPADRRHARPQRLAPGALCRDPRRPHHHGLRSRRAAGSGSRHRREMAAAAGQDAAGRSRPRPAHSRRGAEIAAGAEPPLQGMAGAHPDRARGFAARFGSGADLEPVAARSPADVRLHPGRPENPDDADGDDRRGSGRLDGQRHADLGAVGPGETAFHLFQAELRPGDQSADRPDPRGTGHEPGVHHRAAAEPVRPRGHVEEQAPRSPSADPDQRQSGKDPLDLGDRRSFQVAHVRYDLAGRSRRRGDGRSHRGVVRQGRDRGARRHQHHHPVRPPRRRRPHPDPLAARLRGRAPSSHSRRLAHLGRHRGGIRRAARGASFRLPGRLRRRGDQSVSRLRDAGGDEERAAAETRREGNPQALHQVGRQGTAQGDVEDGHLDLSILLRRADLRRRGLKVRLRRQIFHRHGDPDRGRRACRDRRRGGAPASRRVFRRPDLPLHARRRRRLCGAGARRGARLERGDGGGAAARRARQFLREVPAIRGHHQRSIGAPVHDPRPVPHQVGRGGRPPAGADRGGRAGEKYRQTILHRRHVVRLDLARGAHHARHRHEPDRRQIEHRRGRRGIRPVQAAAERRFHALGDQAGGLGPLRRHRRIPGQFRHDADQDRARRQARRRRAIARAQGR